MIYCNMLWQAFKLDLSQLSEFPIWYADYEKLPQTPYQAKDGRIAILLHVYELDYNLYRNIALILNIFAGS